MIVVRVLFLKIFPIHSLKCHEILKRHRFTHIHRRVKPFLFFFFLLTTTYVSHGQSLQGVITDAVSGYPMYPVTVVNEKTQVAVVSDPNGVYSIAANPGDVIIFSYVGYKVVRHTKPPSVIVATLNVGMEPAENELKEFTLHQSKLSKYQIDSIERQAIYKLPLQRTPPSPFLSPFSAIAEKFSKKAKRTYAFQENFRNGEIEKFVDTRYTPAIVTKLTGLTGDSIGHFMYAYPMPYDFARTSTDLELKMWIRASYKEWLTKGAADTIQTIQQH